MNANSDALRRYHERTKHSASRVQASRHFLDWDIQPRPFKIYTSLAPIPLPRDWQESSAPALALLSEPARAADPTQASVVDLTEIARLLHFSAGIIRTKVYPNGMEHHFRAAACTGALYHIDLYLVCGALSGLEAGVYHFGPHDFALRQLRRGDYRALVAAASGDDPALVNVPAVVISTSTFWRNAWKYEARAYRHCYWDNGTILANLFAAAAAKDIPAQVVLGFVDQTVNDLLDLDTQREVALSMVTLGRPGAVASDLGVTQAPPLRLETLPLSKAEVDYPAIREAHTASSLTAVEEVRAWRDGILRVAAAAPPGPRSFALRPLHEPSAQTVEAIIRKRGSARQFAQRSMRVEQLSTMLIAATSTRPVGALNDIYVIVNAVDQLPSGAYVYHPERQELELLRAGEFRREATYLDLGQELAGDASVNFYMLADLEPIFARYGNRGYRAAQLDGAIIGGRLYLAAYALGLGATGLTFFDDDVTEFFSPHAQGKGVMFLVAAGVRAQSPL